MKISFFENQATNASTQQNANTRINTTKLNNTKAKSSYQANRNKRTELSAQLSANESISKCDGNKIKFYFKSLLIAFSITAIFSFLLISNIDKNIIEKQNSTDYVSVFKESDIYEILFTENE